MLESLTADVIALKVGVNESGISQNQDADKTKMQEEVLKSFIGELGNLGRAHAAAKVGLPPDIAELVAGLPMTRNFSRMVRSSIPCPLSSAVRVCVVRSQVTSKRASSGRSWRCRMAAAMLSRLLWRSSRTASTGRSPDE